jgi:hypothetical protein
MAFASKPFSFVRLQEASAAAEARTAIVMELLQDVRALLEANCKAAAGFGLHEAKTSLVWVLTEEYQHVLTGRTFLGYFNRYSNGPFQVTREIPRLR